MNIPNKLSLFRIFLIPIMAVVYLLDFPYAPLIAVIIFIVAALTDFLDGYIARKYNMVTDLGKLLDPMADKILVLFALFLVTYSRSLQPDWLCAVCGAIIIARELLISIVRQIAASKNIILQANIYGKIKTTVQDISIPIVMLLAMKEVIVSWSEVFYEILYWAGFSTLILATSLTIISGIIYIVQNISIFNGTK